MRGNSAERATQTGPLWLPSQRPKLLSMKSLLLRLCFHLALMCGVDQQALKAPLVTTLRTYLKGTPHHIKIAKHFYS